MTIKFQYKIAFVILVAVLQTTFAQKKDENIGTEVVNVVKPYTPTISDAFKVKETPVLDDEETLKKELINYNIFSLPVASTFTPSKGSAAGVDKTAQERLFKNYATLGFGSYASVNAELFITENIDATDYFAGMLRNQSAQGNIKGVDLDDKFYDTALDLTYGSKQQAYSWNADLGYQNQVYNWYGLPENFGVNLSDADRATLINGINPQQTYHNFYLGGKITTNDSFFNQATVKYNRFWDAYGSAENRFFIKPTFKFSIGESFIKTNFTLDYLNSSFENAFPIDVDAPSATSFANKSSYLILGANPNFQIRRDDLTLNFGVELVYLSTLKNQFQGTDFGSESDFFVYPKITASYKVVGNIMIAYAGAEGGLQQNSYRDFTNQNPFVSPTLLIAPTDSQYDIYVGLKGKLSNNISYNIRGAYASEKNKALFKSNDYSQADTNENYIFGNSFNVVYDNMKTVSFFGELKADFSKNVAFGINGTFATYTNDFEEEAWNLPQIKLGASLDVNITDKWFAGANVFFVGERMDFQEDKSFTTIGNNVKTLEGYLDANLNLGYKYNQRLTAFLKGNNIANQAYEKWLNYPVQQFQVMLGASYKFDF